MHKLSTVILLLTILLLNTVSESSVRPQSESKFSIHFVLPDGYTGAFRLVLDKNTGMDMNLENGRYTLEIPKSGTLKIKSFKPFAELHEKTAAFKSGKEILYNPSTSYMPKSVDLRPVGIVIGDIDENGEMVAPVIWTYIIGTRRQAENLKRRLQKRWASNNSFNRTPN